MNKYDEASKMLCQYLHQMAKEKGITHQQIADKTGFIVSNVTRMLSGKYSPTLVSFMKLADALDAYLFVIDKDADNQLADTMRERWGKVSES
jgi:transcriptional regulator with XRE-family HTH domain